MPEQYDTHQNQKFSQAKPTFKEALLVWVKVALYSFGGPAGQISVMHRFIVEQKQWLSEKRFLHALNFCMLLPGPEAQQLATYTGWLFHKVKGGLVAGGLFILPGFISILLLSILYASYYEVDIVQALFYGIKPAILAIVLGALWKIGQRALKNEVMFALAAVAFVAIFFLNIPFPLIIISAGIIGFFGGKYCRRKFLPDENEQDAGENSKSERPSFKHFLKTAGFWTGLWLLPVIALVLLLDFNNIFVQEGVFFSQVAVLTFGGAYAVLAYVAQQAVEAHRWLEPGEMLDGLGMAETTPGPLIQVVQFVAFMGAYREPGILDPITAGILASILVTWVTFLPCFLFIFSGAPYVEYLRGNKQLSAALAGITAAVVGVILNLALWFGMNVLFGEVLERHLLGLTLDVPEWATFDIYAILLTAFAFFLQFILKQGMFTVLFSTAGLGMVVFLWVV